MIDTQFTRQFGLIYPVMIEPNSQRAQGHLAAEASGAGAMGFVAARACDADWIAAQFRAVGDTAIGCSLSISDLRRAPEFLTVVLSLRPRAIFLKEGDPRSFADDIRRHGCRLICEARSMADLDTVLEIGPDVLVVRGSGEVPAFAGETTFSLVPQVSDYLYTRQDEVSLVASGQVCDSRGVAAMIALGADGVVLDHHSWSGDIRTPEQAGAKAADMAAILRETGGKAERILQNLPRKVVTEPDGPGVTGLLDPDIQSDHNQDKA
ncbi:MAG: nitronate monooxygenase [Pseudomonadota bacterium]